MFYQEVFEALQRNRVRYLIVGGVAINLHGIPRMTYDLDLMIALDEENIRRAWKSLTDAGFSPRVPIKESDLVDRTRRMELKEKKNMLVASFIQGAREFHVVDIFIENPIDFDICYAHKLLVSAGGIDLPVIDIQYLIAMKKLSNRKQDIDDMASLNQLMKNHHG